jgi:hypothetical protein
MDDPTAHPSDQGVYILADALPGFSNFYINYILLSCFLQVRQKNEEEIRGKWFVCRFWFSLIEMNMRFSKFSMVLWGLEIILG